jgi:hypothetical protein
LVGRNLKKWLGDRKSGSMGSEVNVKLSVHSTAFIKGKREGLVGRNSIALKVEES